jgi:hypothetical protein
MSAGITWNCDGTRPGDGRGQPCRGFLPTRELYVTSAWWVAHRAGWRHFTLPDGVIQIDLCPSPNHLEEL